MGFSGTRVLIAHKQAVLDGIKEFGSLYRTDPDDFAHRVVKAVLTATDSKSLYAVAVKDGTGTLLFGPFATLDAAELAVLGHLPAREESLYKILPLIPAPKATRRRK